MSNPLFFDDAPVFREWLASHAASSLELLVAYRKVATGQPSLSYSESVDEALCFGWIDGVRKSFDDRSYTIRFTPRRASSIWSAVNIAKVERLRAEDRMTASGEKAFALRSGAKSAVYAHEQKSPAELSLSELRNFKRHRFAWKFFEETPAGYKKFVLHWVTTAKKEETRTTRLSKLVDACRFGERIR